MNKKIIVLAIIVLLLAVGGVFYWQYNQKDVRELNKNLPEGVRVVKSFFGKEYKVVNKIDGYEFKVPKRLKTLKEIKYFNEENPSLSIEGPGGELMGIGQYKLKDSAINLEDWVKDWTSPFKNFVWIMKKEKIGQFEVIRVSEEEHLAGIPVYFLKKDSKIYGISSTIEELFHEIIINGKW